MMHSRHQPKQACCSTHHSFKSTILQTTPLLIQSLPFNIKLSDKSEQWGKRPASVKAAVGNEIFFELQVDFAEGTVA